jgi:NitT/TauT family transport system permease protein
MFLNLFSLQELLSGLLYSIYIILISLIVSVIVGLGIGIIIGSFKFLKEGLLPYVVLIYAVPKSIFLPIFWFLFGVGFNYQFAFAVFHGILPFIVNISYQLSSINTHILIIARSFGASSLQMYLKVILPSLIPSILGTIRLAFYGIVVGVILAQQFVGTSGVGYLSRYYATTLQTTNLYTLVVITSIIVVIIYWLLIRIELNYLKKRELLPTVSTS